MSMSARIRGHIAEHGPSTVAEIAAALGVPGKVVSMSLSIQRRDGIVSKNGTGKPYVYALLREVAPPISKEEAVRRRKERERNRVRANRQRAGRKPWAEYIALRREEACRRAAERAEAPKVSTPRESAAKVQPSVRKAFDTPIAPRARSVIEVPVVKPVLMTSTEWEANGGKVQRLESNWQKPVGLRSPQLPFF